MINELVLNIFKKYKNAGIIEQVYRDMEYYKNNIEFGSVRVIVYVMPGKRASTSLDAEEEAMSDIELFEYRLSEVTYAISKQLPNFNCDLFDISSGVFLTDLSNLRGILWMITE